MNEMSLKKFRHNLSLLDEFLERSKKKYSDEGYGRIISANNFVVLTINRIKITLESVDIVCHKNDISSAFALCRSLIDSCSSLFFIFKNNTKEEEEFRYLLFLLDGYRNLYNCYINMFECMTKEECYQSDSKFFGFDSMQDEIVSKIKENPLYCDKQLIVDIVKSCNWKYKTLNEEEKSGHNRFTWSEIYEKFYSKKSLSHFTSCYMSIFVHGLSISSMPISERTKLDSALSIYEVLNFIMQELLEFIKSRFEE